MERFDFFMERFSVRHGADVRLTVEFSKLTVQFLELTVQFSESTVEFSGMTALDRQSTVPSVPSVQTKYQTPTTNSLPLRV